MFDDNLEVVVEGFHFCRPIWESMSDDEKLVALRKAIELQRQLELKYIMHDRSGEI